jgi:hypothetical protein
MIILSLALHEPLLPITVYVVVVVGVAFTLVPVGGVKLAEGAHV